AEGGICLTWLNSSDQWVNAIDGNIGANVGVLNFMGSWLTAGSPMDLGAWGVNTADHTVWAVIDHNSQFSVASVSSVPEPAFVQMAALLGMSGLGLVKLRRKA
ncbi:MAG: hypothetical protein WCL39_06825, partial [Armatimonadota bacterium]